MDQQFDQLGKVIRAGPEAALWQASLAPLALSVEPLVSHYVRRRGRPKKEWVPHVLGEAQRRLVGQRDLIQLANAKVNWQKAMANN